MVYKNKFEHYDELCGPLLICRSHIVWLPSLNKPTVHESLLIFWQVTPTCAVFFWDLNPFTPKSVISNFPCNLPPEILHHTVWTWLSLANSDERWLYYQFSRIHFSFKSLGERAFERRSVRIKATFDPVKCDQLSHIREKHSLIFFLRRACIK